MTPIEKDMIVAQKFLDRSGFVPEVYQLNEIQTQTFVEWVAEEYDLDGVSDSEMNQYYDEFCDMISFSQQEGDRETW